MITSIRNTIATKLAEGAVNIIGTREFAENFEDVLLTGLIAPIEIEELDRENELLAETVERQEELLDMADLISTVQEETLEIYSQALVLTSEAFDQVVGILKEEDDQPEG